MSPKSLAEKFDEASRKPVAAEGFLPPRQAGDQQLNLKDQYLRERGRDHAHHPNGQVCAGQFSTRR